jgi:cytochrome c-type biogenesis protein CcmH
MLLWLLFAVMTAGALLAILRPLMRAGPAGAADADAGSVAVYRDQLAEIEADQARGVIDATEAEAARIEVSRRLLALADAQGATGKGSANALLPPPAAMQRVTFAIAGAVPLLALGLYLVYGAPGRPGMPHSEVVEGMARQQQLASAQVQTLISQVETRLRESPQDGKGWDVIAPVYFKVGRFGDAANAFQQALRLLGENVTRLNGFADATVFAADGIVNEDARKAYERVLVLDPKRFEPRFWLALAKEQDGNLPAARADYQKLLAEAPADAPWRSTVEERVALVTQRLEGKGPSSEQMEAAKDMDPADRQRMIEGMVAGLAERLKTNSKDLAGWLRLVRAYSVLNKPEAAKAALADARKALAGDDKALAQLTQLALSLGLGS